MRAWTAQRLCDPPEVRLSEVPTPAPSADEALIRVVIAPVGLVDDLTLRGLYQVTPDLPYTVGSEFFGIVDRPTPNGPSEGTRVLGLCTAATGSVADYCLESPERLLPVDAALSDDRAACLLINYQTALFALTERGHLRAGDTLLVCGGAGGLGSAAIELGRCYGARVLATASNASKVEACLALGAEAAFDSSVAGLKEQVFAVTQGAGVDVVGGDTFLAALRTVAPGGRILSIAFLQRDTAGAAQQSDPQRNRCRGRQLWPSDQIGPVPHASPPPDLAALYVGGELRPLSSSFDFSKLPLRSYVCGRGT